MTMQEPNSGVFDIKVRIPINNLNVHYLADAIWVKVYKLKEEDDNFEKADKVFIGAFHIFWKKCAHEAKDGESSSIPYKYKLCDPEGESRVLLRGWIAGEYQWVRFGHRQS